MHTVVYALAKHEDVAKFELEDGLVRHAATELLARPSSIDRVVVTLPKAERHEVGADHRPPSHDALLRIAAGEPADARPATLDSLIVEVAGVVGGWSVESTSIADRPDSWVGTATRGVTFSLMFGAGPGIDKSSYDGWLRDALMTCSDELDGVGIQQHSLVESFVDGDGFDTILEFSFPTEHSLESALNSASVQAIIGSELLDAQSLRAFAAVEHIHTPNENAWAMHESPVEQDG